MVFWFIRYEDNRLSTRENRLKMNSLLQKLKATQNLQNATFLLLNIDSLFEYNDEIFYNFKVESSGIRGIQNNQSLADFINDNLYNSEGPDQIVNVLYASKSEIDWISSSFTRSNPCSEYDVLVVKINNGIWDEEAKEFELINTSLSFEENLKLLIGTSLNSEIAGNISQKLMKIQSLHQNIQNSKNQVRMLNHFFPNTENKNEIGEGSEIGKKLEEILNAQKRLTNSINEAIDKCVKVKSGLEQNENLWENLSENILKTPVKQPTAFSEDNISISEDLSEDHSNHVFTLTNNTAYVWQNLTIFSEAKKIRLAEVSHLEFKSEIKIDYDFELSNELGYYSIQVYYGAWPVSKKVYVCRAKIIKFYLKNPKVATVKTKNMGQLIKNCCILCVKSNDQNFFKSVTTNLKNFAEEEINFQNLTPGEYYTLYIKSEKEGNLLLCPPFVAILEN